MPAWFLLRSAFRKDTLRQFFLLGYRLGAERFCASRFDNSDAGMETICPVDDCEDFLKPEVEIKQLKHEDRTNSHTGMRFLLREIAGEPKVRYLGMTLLVQ